MPTATEHRSKRRRLYRTTRSQDAPTLFLPEEELMARTSAIGLKRSESCALTGRAHWSRNGRQHLSVGHLPQEEDSYAKSTFEPSLSESPDSVYRCNCALKGRSPECFRYVR